MGTDLRDLRRRLDDERRAILAELADGDALAPGFLRLLADAHTAVAAIDTVQAEDASLSLVGRAVLTDDPSRPLTLTTYAPNGAPLAVCLDPLRALALAADLTEAARRRLERGEP